MGEKPRNMYKQKPRKKSPVWLPSHPLVNENEGVRKDRKQAGPALGGTGALV